MCQCLNEETTTTAHQAGVAQLVEQLPRKHQVAGSNPCRWHQFYALNLYG